MHLSFPSGVFQLRGIPFLTGSFFISSISFLIFCSMPTLLDHQNQDHNSSSLQDKFCVSGMKIVTLMNRSFVKYIWILDKMMIHEIPFILINSARGPCRIKETIFILYTTYLFSRSNTFGHALVGTWTRDLSLIKGRNYFIKSSICNSLKSKLSYILISAK